jgi:hypothetical protein
VQETVRGTPPGHEGAHSGRAASRCDAGASSWLAAAAATIPHRSRNHLVYRVQGGRGGRRHSRRNWSRRRRRDEGWED